jgi:hypothetical protein
MLAPMDCCCPSDSTVLSQAFSAKQQAMMTEMLLCFLMGMMASFAQNGLVQQRSQYPVLR